MHKFIALFVMLSCVQVAARGQTIDELELQRLTQRTQASSLRYWFDADASSMQTTEDLSGTYILDVSCLSVGLHTLHYQVVDENNTVSHISSSAFIKWNEPERRTTASSLRYWFDEDQNVTVTEIANGIHMLDASMLAVGLHTLHYQIIDNKGGLNSAASTIFLKANEQMASSSKAKSLRYWFDNDASSLQVTDVMSGMQIIDASSLPPGLHILHSQIIDSEEKVASPVSDIFFKDFNKITDNRIVKYQYWMNDNVENGKTVSISNASNPYALIDLLPMQNIPIRSSQFHFEMSNNTPMIYAKNTFRIRFFDAAGYFRDDESNFTDYAVSAAVEPVGELLPTQTFDKVTHNAIRWYSVNVEVGDTLAFKSSQATTIQLFSPSGKELYKAEGAASVNYGGCHTWESGTHYLAIHDVTGNKATMSLDYMHMDKYDVVDWDVHTVGNGGCSTITFKGNGFRDLYRVDLYNATGDTIRSVDVGHESDAETSVTFDFSGTTLGKYHALFHFTQEDKHFANILTVEEAVDIELATNVSFPSSFLRGTSTTYTIKITNLGNMTAYQVPIYIYIRNISSNAISHITIDGLNLPKLYDFLNKDSLTTSELNEMKELEERIGDDHYFTFHKIGGEEFGRDSVCIRSNYFFTNVSPNETKTINMQIKSSEEIFAWVTVPYEWLTINTNKESVPKRIRFRVSSNDPDAICCYREKFECFFNASASIIGLGNILADLGATVTGENPVSLYLKVADCVAGALNASHSFVWTLACGQKESPGGDDMFSDNMSKLFNFKNESGLSVVNNCIQAAYPKLKIAKVLGVGSNLMDIFGGANVWADCQDAFTEWKPGCPPCTTCPGGGSSTPQPPADPNDIYGYLSETGSKFIADSVAKVNYTIEFENDTTFAKAAAHTIVIRDTLDSRYFDLKAFLPTCVKIGERETFLDENTDVKTTGGVTCFLKTIDMRPEINAIAQVEGEYSQQTGIATWTFTSLDPMTMEPTDDLMQGILPMNYNGTSGIGEVMFEVGVKPNKGDGTNMENRAGIIFDYEEAILTPTWTNIVDAVAPQSMVTDVTMDNDTIATLHVLAEDNLSGVWYYDVYAQYGKNTAWVKVGEHVTDSLFDFRVYEDIDYGFCVLAVDSAGNVEKKQLTREWPQSHIPTATPEIPSGTSVTSEPVYDLGGRQVPASQEGILVQKGRKRAFRRK